MSNLPSGIDNYQPEQRQQFLSRAAVTVELDLYSASQIMNYLNKYAELLTDTITRPETNQMIRDDLRWLRSRVVDHANIVENKIRQSDD